MESDADAAAAQKFHEATKLRQRQYDQLMGYAATSADVSRAAARDTELAWSPHTDEERRTYYWHEPSDHTQWRKPLSLWSPMELATASRAGPSLVCEYLRADPGARAVDTQCGGEQGGGKRPLRGEALWRFAVDALLHYPVRTARRGGGGGGGGGGGDTPSSEGGRAFAGAMFVRAAALYAALDSVGVAAGLPAGLVASFAAEFECVAGGGGGEGATAAAAAANANATEGCSSCGGRGEGGELVDEGGERDPGGSAHFARLGELALLCVDALWLQPNTVGAGKDGGDDTGTPRDGIGGHTESGFLGSAQGWAMACYEAEPTQENVSIPTTLGTTAERLGPDGCGTDENKGEGREEAMEGEAKDDARDRPPMSSAPPPLSVCSECGGAAATTITTTTTTTTTADQSDDQCSLFHLFRHSFARFSDRPCLGTRTGPPGGLPSPDPGAPPPPCAYEWSTFGECWRRLRGLGSGVLGALDDGDPAGGGVGLATKQIMVGICSKNRPEWLLSDLACFTQGMVSVPIPFTADLATARHIMGHAELQVIVCSAGQCLDLVVRAVNAIAADAEGFAAGSATEGSSGGLAAEGPAGGSATAELPHPDPLPLLPRLIIVMDDPTGTANNDGDDDDGTKHQGVYESRAEITAAIDKAHASLLKGSGGSSAPRVLRFSTVVSEGEANPRPLVPTRDADIATLIYTSGSTGRPKGAVLSYRRWVKFLETTYGMPSVAVQCSFAPLAHVAERQSVLICVVAGGQVGFYGGDIENVVDDVSAVRPTLILAVPRFFNMLYSSYQARMVEGIGEYDRCDMYERALIAAKLEDKGAGNGEGDGNRSSVPLPLSPYASPLQATTHAELAVKVTVEMRRRDDLKDRGNEEVRTHVKKLKDDLEKLGENVKNLQLEVKAGEDTLQGGGKGGGDGENGGTDCGSSVGAGQGQNKSTGATKKLAKKLALAKRKLEKKRIEVFNFEQELEVKRGGRGAGGGGGSIGSVQERRDIAKTLLDDEAQSFFRDDILGGRMQVVVTGSAPTSGAVKQWMRVRSVLAKQHPSCHRAPRDGVRIRVYCTYKGTCCVE